MYFISHVRTNESRFESISLLYKEKTMPYSRLTLFFPQRRHNFSLIPYKGTRCGFRNMDCNCAIGWSLKATNFYESLRVFIFAIDESKNLPATIWPALRRAHKFASVSVDFRASARKGSLATSLDDRAKFETRCE